MKGSILVIRIVESSEKAEKLSIREELSSTLCKNEKFLLPYCSIDHILQAIYWLIVN